MKMRLGVLSLPLDEGKTDLAAVGLVFLVDVLNEGLEVFRGFLRHGFFLFRPGHTGNIIAYL